MQISKLYSNDVRFKNITFNLNGLNVIYADVKTKNKEKKNSHSLGKTKLAELIDFLLLKEITKNHFLLKIKEKDKSIFINHIFYLEIYLNSGEFLTIKRSVESKTKISFIKQAQTVNEYNPPLKWDYENIPIKKARKILTDYLSFDFFKNKPYNFRKAIGYSLRSQDDFKDVYRLKKFSRGRDIYWKPFVFDLLGFDGELLTEKYNSDSEIDDIESIIDTYKNDYSVNVSVRDEIVAEQSILKDEFKQVENQIDKFDFYEQDKSLIKEGVEEIEQQISNLNAKSYKVNYNLKKLNASIKNNFSFDIEKVKKIFEEASIHFSNQLQKEYDDLLSFNKKITTERNKLIKNSIKEKKEELTYINAQLIELNQERENLLSYLTNEDTFIKFKKYQKDLVKLEGQLLVFQKKIDAIDLIIEKQNKIETLQKNIKDTADQIKRANHSTDKNKKYQSIRKLFSKYYKTIMNENAVLSWSVNSNNNVEFPPPKITSKIDRDKNTAKGEGNTYMKLLCVSFDLAILSEYNEESYFRFAYHDDVLSQQDDGIKNRFLELIRKNINNYNLQYILSVIKSDLPLDDNDNIVTFSDEEIVLSLHDKNSNGTLFGFIF